MGRFKRARIIGLRGPLGTGLLATAIAIAMSGATALTFAPSIPASAATTPQVPLGVYAGAANPSGVTSFASTMGTNVTYAEDYLPGGPGWAAMDGAGGDLNWLLGPWQGTGSQMVLSVPIIPNDSSGNALGTLAGGAAGDYNSYFVTLADTLVSYGFGNAILRIGQEFTISGYAWSVSTPTDAANFATFYQQVVNSMRSVSGQSFKFIWEGASGPAESGQTWTASEAYPGNSYVDYIGTDVYDQTWNGSCGLPFNNTSTTSEAQCVWNNATLPGITGIQEFAQFVGKPTVFPEWGLAIRGDGHGLGDDPVFINNMTNYFVSNNVAFDIYFNFDETGQIDSITDGNFPNSLASFQQAFDGSSSGSSSSGSSSSGSSSSGSSSSGSSSSGSSSSGSSTSGSSTSCASSSSSTSAPAAPCNLTATVSGTTVTLAWTNPSGKVDGNNVYRDGTKIAWPGWPNPVVTSYIDSSVAAGSHTYDVVAYNGYGQGATSNSVTVVVSSSGSSSSGSSSSGSSSSGSSSSGSGSSSSGSSSSGSSTSGSTKSCAASSSSTSAPAVPCNLTATVSGTTVTLTWTNPSGKVDGDNVYRDSTKIAWPGWPNAVVTTYTDSNVAAGSHTYKVAAYNGYGQGPSVSVKVTVA